MESPEITVNSKELRLLERIAEAKNAEPGYMMLSTKRAKYLESRGLIESNPDIALDDTFAVRATQEGLDYLASTRTEGEQVPAHFEAPEDVEEEVVAEVESETEEATRQIGQGSYRESLEGSFELEDEIPLPKSRRRVKSVGKYPFEQMQIGQSFHVPKTEETPNPSKSMASTVSTAKNRFKDEDGNLTRIFVIRTVGAEDPKGPGARIFRIEDFAK